MSLSRKDFFIQTLQEEFNNNPKSKAYCVDAVNSPAMLPRTFDHIQHLLPESDLKELSHSFRTILMNVNPAEKNQLKLTRKEQMALIKLQRSIAAFGCEILLNEQKNVRPDMLDLLEYQNTDYSETEKTPQQDLNKVLLVCAFVGSVNQYLFSQVQDLVHKNNNGIAATSHFITKHYDKWVEDTINNVPIVSTIDKIHDILDEVTAIAAKNPLITTGALVTFGVFGAAAVTAFAAYKSTQGCDLLNQAFGEGDAIPKPTGLR